MALISSEFKQFIHTSAIKKNPEARFHKLNFFHFLQTTEGFLELQHWFVSRSGAEVDEYKFYDVMKEVIIDLNMTTAWEIFDMCATDNTITFKEFILILLLYAAVDNKEAKLALYLFGAQFFQLIAGKGNHEISAERMRRLGRIIGLSELAMLYKLRQLKISPMSAVTYEQFQLFYYDIFDEIDYVESVPQPVASIQIQLQLPPNPEHIPINHEEVVPLPLPKPKIRRKKHPKGCGSKHCSLL